MGVNVTLVVPSANPSETISFERAITARWGGLTTWQARGLWRNDKGVMVGDAVTMFACSVRAMADEDVYQWWHALAESVRRVFKQECVFLSFTPQDAELVGDGHTERIGGNDGNVQDAS